MGAWGLAFFQSDYDLDCMWELEDESGLTGNDCGWNRSAESRQEISFYRPPDPDILCQQLDDGALAKVIVCNLKKLKDPNRKCEAFTPEYKLVLMTAVAMKFGCKIPSKLRNYTATNYRRVGIQRDAMAEMELALHDYKDGVPYEIGGKCLQETIDDLKRGIALPDRLSSGVVNTTCPRYGAGHKCAETDKAYSEYTVIEKDSATWKRQKDEDARIESSAKDAAARLEFERKAREAGEFDFPPDTCGNCGKADGQLKRCSRCLLKRYCSKDCQATHWPRHKVICPRAPKLLRSHIGSLFGGESGGFPDLASLRASMPGMGDGSDTSAEHETITRMSADGTTTYKGVEKPYGSVFTVSG